MLTRKLPHDTSRCAPLQVEMKELEKEMTDARKSKEKEEQERKVAGTKKGKKFTGKINMGSSAGLEEEVYNDTGDDFDFM